MIGRVHLPLFLLAVMTAVAIKVTVDQDPILAETTITAPVRYELPPEEEKMILDPREEVKVRLRGPRNEIALLNPFTVEVAVSLAPGEEGEIDVTEDRLEVHTPPGDFEVVYFEPNRFLLTVEQVVRATLEIRVELTGEPSAGALPGTLTISPEKKVEVMGPRSRVDLLEGLSVPVSLDGHGFSFTEENVTLVSPDPLVRILEPRQVTVDVEMNVPGAERVEGLSEESEPR